MADIPNQILNVSVTGQRRGKKFCLVKSIIKTQRLENCLKEVCMGTRNRD